MIERFQKHLFSSFTLDQETRILVGYSGGADSTCLLHLMKQLEMNIIAAHLHHGLRAEATKEQTLCEQFCKEQGIPFFTKNVNIAEFAKNHKIGIEEAGRKVRYLFFQDLVIQQQCSFITTAHTMDDQTETILFNLTRGAGLAGLCGIPEKREQIIRPLLIFKRAETIAYCKEYALWFHQDPSNKDPKFSRSRIRHFVLPHLVAINKNLKENLSHLSKIACEENAFLDEQAREILDASSLKLNGELSFLTKNQEYAYRLDVLLSYSTTLLRRALRLIASNLQATLNYLQTNFIVDQLKLAAKGSITAEGGRVIFKWDSESLYAYQKRDFLKFEQPVSIPGQIKHKEGGWLLSVIHEKNNTQNMNRQSLSVWMDSQKIKGSLFIRTYQAGDKMQPIGFHSKRKLKDLFSEVHLTQMMRHQMPVLCDQEGPIWVPGVSIADRVKQTLDTKKGIELFFGPF